MKPQIVVKSTFHVIGMARNFTPSTNTRIGELWSRFAARMQSVPNRVGAHSYGVCLPSFEYYDERFNPLTGEGEVDIYVAIVAPA